MLFHSQVLYLLVATTYVCICPLLGLINVNVPNGFSNYIFSPPKKLLAVRLCDDSGKLEYLSCPILPFLLHRIYQQKKMKKMR